MKEARAKSRMASERAVTGNGEWEKHSRKALFVLPSKVVIIVGKLNSDIRSKYNSPSAVICHLLLCFFQRKE